MCNRPKVAVILDYACIDERVGRILEMWMCTFLQLPELMCNRDMYT